MGNVLFMQERLLAKPMLAQGLEQQAQAAQQAGDYNKAIALWQQVIQKTPKSAEAYYNLGLSYHYAIDLEKAIVAYQEAIRLNPKYDSPYINLGLLRLQIGQPDEAEQLFRKVLTIPDRYEDPASSHTIAHYNLAVILSRKGQKKEALASVQQALAITPNFAPAQKLLNQLK
jgi:tetratricopeptide (TPR) repeat protein